MTSMYPTVGPYLRNSESGCLDFKRAIISVQKLFHCKHNTAVEIEDNISPKNKINVALHGAKALCIFHLEGLGKHQVSE